MDREKELAVFEDYKIRRVYDETTETWYFSVIDVVQALIQQSDYQTARKYWNKLKERLQEEGSQSVTNCHQLKRETWKNHGRSEKWIQQRMPVGKNHFGMHLLNGLRSYDLD
jgi:hypothetical protein